MEPKNSQAVKLKWGRVEFHVERRHLLFHWFLALQHHMAALDCWGDAKVLPRQGMKLNKCFPEFESGY